MKPPTIWPMTACLCVAAGQVAFAQSNQPRSPRDEFAFAVGIGRTQQLDATASPLQFGGEGVDVTAHYVHTAGRFVFSSSVDGGPRSLSSIPSATSIAERVTAGELRLGIQRIMGATPETAKLSIGVDAAGMLSVTAHHYDDPTHSISNFVIGSVTLGPSVAWRQSIGQGAGRIQLSIPVVGLVDHPYSDERASSTLNARFATLSTISGASVTVAYAPAAMRRLGIEYAYHLSTLRYSDVQPLRSMTQALSVGFVTRFGQSAP